jgi:hypothetical protein
MPWLLFVTSRDPRRRDRTFANALKRSGHKINLSDRLGQHNRGYNTFSTWQVHVINPPACCLDDGTAICKAAAVKRLYVCTNEGGMTTFDKREDGFEKKFAHDEELQFKAMARRNKLLGLWAAAILGKAGPEADAYAKEVVLSDFEEVGDNDVLRKVAKDLQGKGVTEQQIRAQMTELLGQAIEQIKKSG